MHYCVGEILLWPNTHIPGGYAACNGQLLPIHLYQNLFQVIGTTYGGDGISTFALPDLRGRFAMGAGQRPGASNFPPGMALGQETVTLTAAQMPPHQHPVAGHSTAFATEKHPGGNVFAHAEMDLYGDPAQAVPTPAPPSVGGGQPHDNLSPWLGLQFIIALEGHLP